MSKATKTRKSKSVQAKLSPLAVEVLACLGGNAPVGARVSEIATDVFSNPIWGFTGRAGLSVQQQRRAVRDAIQELKSHFGRLLRDRNAVYAVHTQNVPFGTERIGYTLTSAAYRWSKGFLSGHTDRAGI